MPRLVAPVVDSGRLASVDQPVLTGGGAALRPWRDADADAVVDAFRDEQIERWHIRRLDRAEAVSWIGDWRRRWAAETDASWSIVEPGGDEATGYVAIRGISYEGTAAASLLHADGWHDMHVHVRIAARDAPAERVGRPPKRSIRGSTMIGSKEEQP
jgi:hypothetical protein